MDSLRKAMHAEVSGVPPLGDIDRAIQRVTIVRRRWAGLVGLAAAMVGLVVALSSPWSQPGVMQPAAPQPTPTRTSARGTPASILVAIIPIDGRDHGIAVDETTSTVLVACTNGLNVIDMVTRKVIDIVGMPGGGGNVADVAVDPAVGNAYLTRPAAGKVTVVDTVTREVVAEIMVGSNPAPVAVDPTAKALYVGNAGDWTVSVIDTHTRKVVDTVAVEDKLDQVPPQPGPMGLAVDPTTGDVYVTNGAAGTVSVIDRDSHKVVATVAGLDDPEAVVVDPSTGEAYVSNAGDGTVSVIDTRTHKVIDTIEVARAGGVAVDLTAGVVYVTGDGLIVLDSRTHKVMDTIEEVGGGEIAVDPTTGEVYVGHGDHGQISVFGAP